MLSLYGLLRLILWIWKYQSYFAHTNDGQGHVAARADEIVIVSGSAHTQIEGSSQVLNGDVTKAKQSQSSSCHKLVGGSVRKQSKFVNGNMDRESFLAFFCNGSRNYLLALDWYFAFESLELTIYQRPLLLLCIDDQFPVTSIFSVLKSGCITFVQELV